MPSKHNTSTTTRKAKPTSSPSPLKNSYLLAYNAVSAALWAGVLYRSATIGTEEVLNARMAHLLGLGKQNGMGGLEALGSGKVFDELDTYTRMTQSLAGLEVLHSLLGEFLAPFFPFYLPNHELTRVYWQGIVRAPFSTTLIQVFSRFLLVWGIAYSFPESTQHNPAFATMLLAWSFTEVVRYSYFVFSLSGIGVPKLWTWLRYNTFLVLYPLGVASECWLIYSAIPLASEKRPELGYALWAVLAGYIPGFYILFTHMLKQRRRIMRESRKTL